MVSDKVLHQLKQISDFADIGCRCTPDQKSGTDPSVCSMCLAGGFLNSICTDIENAHREIFPIGNDNLKSE